MTTHSHQQPTAHQQHSRTHTQSDGEKRTDEVGERLQRKLQAQEERTAAAARGAHTAERDRQTDEWSDRSRCLLLLAQRAGDTQQQAAENAATRSAYAIQYRHSQHEVVIVCWSCSPAAAPPDQE